MSLLNGPVKIGLLWPMTGPQSWAGLECIEAGQAIVAMLEDEGVIDRGQVELLVGDASSAESTLNVAREHIANGANVLHGTIVSDWVLPAAQYASEHGVLYWEAVAASEDITSAGLDNFFRVNVNCLEYGRDMADFITGELGEALGVDATQLRVGIAYQAASFTRSLAEELRDHLKRSGSEVSFYEEVSPSDTEFADVVQAFSATGPHVVVASTFGGPTPNLYSRLVETGNRPTAWLGTGSWALHQKVESLGPLLDGIFAAGTPHLAATSDQGLTERARTRFGRWRERTTIPHNDRTAVDRDLSVIALEMLLVDILPYVHSWDLREIRQRVLALDLPFGDSILGYGAKFTELGDNERSFAAILQWQDGGLETVSPALIATAPIRPFSPS